MPLFQNLDVRYKLRRLEIITHSDRWYGVEPYVIPVFFKIDGERYSAVIRLLNTQAPEEGTTQVAETTVVQLQLVSDPERDPFTFRPAGPILRSEISDLKDGDAMTGSDLDIKFETTLMPIPLTLDVIGFVGLEAILEGLRAPLGQVLLGIGEFADVVNLAFQDLSQLLGQFLGLDETIDVCPGLDLDSDEFINRIEAEFRGLIPGTIGGAFVLMENDDWDEDDAETAQSSMLEFLRDTINDITDSVTRVNPIPETDIDPAEAQEELLPDLIGDLVFRWDPGFWFSHTAGWLWGGPDDFVGTVVRTFNHIEIGDEDHEFSQTAEGDGNEWRLTAKLSIE